MRNQDRKPSWVPSEKGYITHWKRETLTQRGKEAELQKAEERNQKLLEEKDGKDPFFF